MMEYTAVLVQECTESNDGYNRYDGDNNKQDKGQVGQ